MIVEGLSEGDTERETLLQLTSQQTALSKDHFQTLSTNHITFSLNHDLKREIWWELINSPVIQSHLMLSVRKRTTGQWIYSYHISTLIAQPCILFIFTEHFPIHLYFIFILSGSTVRALVEWRSHSRLHCHLEEMQM